MKWWHFHKWIYEEGPDIWQDKEGVDWKHLDTRVCSDCQRIEKATVWLTPFGGSHWVRVY